MAGVFRSVFLAVSFRHIEAAALAFLRPLPFVEALLKVLEEFFPVTGARHSVIFVEEAKAPHRNEKIKVCSLFADGLRKLPNVQSLSVVIPEIFTGPFVDRVQLLGAGRTDAGAR
jgi:hypothetical protein